MQPPDPPVVCPRVGAAALEHGAWSEAPGGAPQRRPGWEGLHPRGGGAAVLSSGAPASSVTRQVTVWPPIGRKGEASTRSPGEVWVVLPWGFDACHLRHQVKTVLIGEVWACQGVLSGSDGGGTVVWRPCWGLRAGGQSSPLSRGWSVCLPDLRTGGPHSAPGGFKAEVTFQTLL